MKIVFAIKALGNTGGGAERVLTSVASGLARRKHEVTVISSDETDQPSYYELDPSIRQVRLGIGDVTGRSGMSDVVRRVAAYRRALSEVRPDVAIAFMHSTYVPLGLAMLGLGIPMIASEHIGPEHYRARIMERALMSMSPLLAAATTVVSEQVRDSYGWWLKRKMRVVHNPVLPPKRSGDPVVADSLSRAKVLLSVGRLAQQKNHQCLIQAFATIAKEFPEWNLRIVGEGELRGALEAQVRSLGMDHRVQLPGAMSDVGKEYAAADIFVLPSLYESFGLATAEALLCGLPAVGFADCQGTNRLIRDGVNGVLVGGGDRATALGSALRALMGAPERRRQLAAATNSWLLAEYGIESVLDRWEELLVQEITVDYGAWRR